MDIPSNIIEAVKETKQDLATATKPTTATKASPKWVKESSKRVLHAIGNGLRTASSIANALNEPKAKIVSRLWHLKDSGLVHGVKKQGSNEFKYYLTTDKPTLEKLDLTPKPKRKYTKRKLTTRIDNQTDDLGYDAYGVNTGNTFNSAPKENKQVLLGKYVVEVEAKLAQVTDKLVLLEVALADKEKEVWTLECEVFDKKAVIKYLEEKLFAKGVTI